MARLLRRVARTAVIAGTAKGAANRVSRRQHGRWAAKDQEQQQEQQQAPAPSRSDALNQLQQLGELKSQGVLTEEEFQAEKRKILGS
ncbi:MAG TPA: SHOCT domain-containing protein [Amycolatopsis sp.]|nr:SHOCT domain-containing protein [Amycolatopsis sp.]